MSKIIKIDAPDINLERGRATYTRTPPLEEGSTTLEVSIYKRLAYLEELYIDQITNTNAHGNPFINALKGQIDGLKYSLDELKKEKK